MNWYRVGFWDGKGQERVCKVQAHNAGDAASSAFVKLKMFNAHDAEPSVLDCIETPGWARAAVEAAERATRDLNT